MNQANPEYVDTLIIGGGVSGLSCARQLHAAGHSFLVVTETPGGRVALSKRGHNLGAVMMNNDYLHIKKHARKAFSSRPWNAYIWNGGKGVNSLLLVNIFKLRKLSKVMGEFNEALVRFRASATHSCQKELLENDPLLSKLVAQNSVDFVREHGLESLVEHFLGPVASSVFLCDWKDMNAFHFCIGISCTGNGACTADWSGTVQSITEGFSEKIIIDSVHSLEQVNDGKAYRILCQDRQYQASNVVLSIPGPALSQLLELPRSADSIPCHVIHVEGRRKSLYRPGKTLIMGPEHDVKLFSALPDGVDVLYANTASPDFNRYYDEFTVIEQCHWQPATQLSGPEWRPLQLQHNLFSIGDHNICGLEDSYITGLFAANRIIGAA